MLKKERHDYIIDKLNTQGSVTVNEIIEELEVSDMTVRRDLSELEKAEQLTRVHGGAIQITSKMGTELSHEEKKIINIEAKEYISEIARHYIEDNDIVFLGPGTTIEILARKITDINALFITNCLPVFNELISKDIKTYLIGGEMRRRTQAFNGDLTLSMLEKLKFTKAFFSCNAVNSGHAMTATIAEGKVQSMALDNSRDKYLLIDSSKIGKEDFYTYYNLEDLSAVITNDDELHLYQEIEKYTKTIIE